MISPPKIFEFHDVRAYLKKYLEFLKEKNPRYSHRALAQSLGMNSSTLLRILGGERNITQKTLPQFITQFKLSRQESEYFELLVLLEQSKDPQTQWILRDRINQTRKTKFTTVESSQYLYYQDWYHAVIREYISLNPCTKDSYKKIAKSLKPKISAPQAKSSLQLLEDLNLIEINPHGFYQQTNATLTTGDKWTGLAIHNFQKQMSRLSEEALDSFEKSQRDISTITMGLSTQGLERMKLKLKEVRKELIQISLDDEGQDKVFQLNFHLFPVAEIDEDPA